MTDKEKLYGWVSKKSINIGNGYNIYLDTNGKEVTVTNVTNDPKDSKGYEWDDAVFVGELTKHVITVKATNGLITIGPKSIGGHG